MDILEDLDIRETVINKLSFLYKHGLEISMYPGHYFYQPFSAFRLSDKNSLYTSYQEPDYETATPDSYFNAENGIRIKELIDLPFKNIIFLKPLPINYEARQTFVISLLFIYFKSNLNLIDYLKEGTFSFVANSFYKSCTLRPKLVNEFGPGLTLFSLYLENGSLIFKKQDGYVSFEV